MPNYRIKFAGRPVGSIGIFPALQAERAASTPELAVLALYDEFEHIVVRRIDEIDPDPTQEMSHEQGLSASHNTVIDKEI